MSGVNVRANTCISYSGYILPDAIAHGSYNIMPVISCLNLPLSDAYIETNDNSTNPPAVSGTSLP